MPLTTSETIDAIIVKFKERFGAELSVNDSVIRNIEALPEGLYGSIVYMGQEATNYPLGGGQAEVTQSYMISVGLRTEADANAILRLYDTLDTITGWLKFNRFGLGWVSPTGARNTMLERRDDTDSPNVFGVSFVLDELRGGVSKTLLPDEGELVTSINLKLNINDTVGDVEVLWRRE